MPRADEGLAAGLGLLWAFPSVMVLGARAMFSYLKTFVLVRLSSITKEAQSKGNHAILKNSLDKEEGRC